MKKNIITLFTLCCLIAACNIQKEELNTNFSTLGSLKNGDTIIADISEWINDLYLESNGTDGVISYSQVVELTVAYFEMKK